METMGITDCLNSFRNKKVLITGHTGFKGSWLSIWLNMLGAEVVGVALEPRTKKDIFVLSGIGDKITDYREDIRNFKTINKLIKKEKPDIIFHLAAQPIVLEGYKEPLYTYETNINGTIHTLESIRNLNLTTIGIFITSDKCYENKEWIYGYRETDPMGGDDPYSSSKGAAELIINSYKRSFFDNESKIACVRAGNVIGGGDWAPYRIVPDFIKAVENNDTLQLRNPDMTRPWQHVLEPLGGYLLLGAKMMKGDGKYDGAWNFGPETNINISVKELVQEMINEYGKGDFIDISDKNKVSESRLLSLDISKAKKYLNWHPVLSFSESVKFTIEWYKKYMGTDVHDFCINQISEYTEKWILKREK